MRKRYLKACLNSLPSILVVSALLFSFMLTSSKSAIALEFDPKWLDGIEGNGICNVLAPTGPVTVTSDAPPRLAFIAGNSAYDKLKSPLDNPRNDAAAMARLFRALGFRVFLTLDATAAELRACVDRAAAAVQAAETTVLYFSGHGIQIEDANYLVGIDATRDSQDLVAFVAVDEVAERLQQSTKRLLIFLDACRDNPFGDQFQNGLAPVGRAGRSRSGNSAKTVNPTPLFISYATSPNNFAFEGQGDVSFFTAALFEHAQTPGWPLERVMAAVSQSVGEATDWQQTPWRRSALDTPVFLNGELEAREAAAIAQAKAAAAQEALEQGNRSAAIAAALSGLPQRWQEARNPIFGDTLEALKTAIVSRVFRVPYDTFLRYTMSEAARRVVLIGQTEAELRLAQVPFQLWNMDGSKLIRELLPPDQMAGPTNQRPFAFSVDGSIFAVSTRDADIVFFRSSDGSEVGRFNFHNELKSQIKFFPYEQIGEATIDFSSNRENIIISTDARFIVANIHISTDLSRISLKNIRSILADNDMIVREIAISPDGKIAYFLHDDIGASYKDRFYRFVSYDLELNKILWEHKTGIVIGGTGFGSLKISPDDTVLSLVSSNYSSGGSTYEIWTIDTRNGSTIFKEKLKKRSVGDLFSTTTFTSDSKYIIGIIDDEALFVWALDRNGQAVDPNELPYIPCITSAYSSNDGAWLGSSFCPEPAVTDSFTETDFNLVRTETGVPGIPYFEIFR